MQKRRRIIPAEQAPETQRWELPSVDDERAWSSTVEEEEIPEPPTAEELEAIRQAARQEGWQAGHEQGLQAGQAAAEAAFEQMAEQWRTLTQALTRPLEPMDEALENQILLLVTRLVRHIVHREMQTTPDEIIPVIREALAALPENSRQVRVLLHPDDVQLVQTLLGDTQGENWQAQPDPSLQRGDCLVKAEYARVDARLDKRLDQLITAFLGDRRQAVEDPDHEPPSP